MIKMNMLIITTTTTTTKMLMKMMIMMMIMMMMVMMMMMISFVTLVYCTVCGFVQLYIYITHSCHWQEQELSVIMLLIETEQIIASVNTLCIIMT